MSNNNYIKKRAPFKHLTIEKRAQIEILLKQNMSKIQIAKEVGIARSTLYNELKRGSTVQKDTQLKEYKKYFCELGQKVYEQHRKNSRLHMKYVDAYEFITFAENAILNDKLSPDAICGAAKSKKNFTKIVSTKTLYNYIDMGLLKVRNIDLPLRVKRKTKTQKNRKNRRILGMSIEERPDIINNREEFGHWEIDTVIGKKETSSVLLTLDERVTRHRHIVKISSKSCEGVKEGLEKIAGIYGDKFTSVFKSITSDNGSEFSELTNLLPEAKIYFAHPYSSFERGTNEKQNSLVRRFFPKGKSFDEVSEEAVEAVETWINNLPRKIFNYSSSKEMFNSVLFDLAI